MTLAREKGRALGTSCQHQDCLALLISIPLENFYTLNMPLDRCPLQIKTKFY